MSTKSTTELQLPDTKDTASNDPPRANREWAHRLETFGDNSSFSAAVYEFKSKSILKRFLWGLIVVSAVAGFCYITAENIKELIEEPISTSITENRQNELEFPAVTVCSLSFLNTTVLEEATKDLGISGFDIETELEALFAYAQETPPNSDNCEARAQNIMDKTNYQGGFSSLLTDLARNNPTDLVIKCSFQGENCKDDLVPINTISGECFTFNGPSSNPPQKVQGTGVRQGLRIELVNGNQQFSLNNNYGYNVIVHNRDEPPRPESEGVVVGQTSNLYVGMRQVTSNDKTRYYSEKNCVTDANLEFSGNLSYSGYTDYSSSLCLNDCFYTQIADKCNCIERGFYTPAKSPYTEMKDCTVTDLCCEVAAFDRLTDNCDCPQKCEVTTRTLTASSATHSFSDRVGINVYYETLISEDRETEDSYSPWSLISDIGGNTGLFLGFTLLTVGEVVLLVLALFTDCCCSSCKGGMRKRTPWSWFWVRKQ